MSKITLAFGSFVLGVCLTFLLGNHTSIVPQSGFFPIGTVLANDSAQHVTFGANNFAPKIPGFGPIAISKGNIMIGGRQVLDGFHCDGCTFKDVTFEYFGGATLLATPKFSGNVRLELGGAAANTVNVVEFFQTLANGSKPSLPNPNAPIIKTVDLKTPAASLMTDLVTPYNGESKK